MNIKIHSVGRCPLCGQGEVIIVKENLTNDLLLICDDCESQWENPMVLISGGDPIDQEYSNLDEKISDEEIKRAGWDKYIKRYI